MLTLPVPPSTNNLFATVGKRRIRSQEYIAWSFAAGMLLKAQHPTPVHGHVAVVIRIPEKTRGDIDNRIKGPLDLLVKHGVIDDDRFVRSLHIDRYDGKDMELEVRAA